MSSFRGNSINTPEGIIEMADENGTVRVSDNYDLETAKSDILERFGYLTFDKMFPSFKMMTFTCDDQYQLLTENSVRALPYMFKDCWDAEDKFSLHPVDDGATATVETSGELSLNSESGLNAVTNTRNLTGSGSGTLYVKVQNIGGLNFYVFSKLRVEHIVDFHRFLDLYKVLPIHLILVMLVMLLTHSDSQKPQMVFGQLEELNILQV